MRRGFRCSAVLSVALVLLSFLLCASVLSGVHGASLAEWKQRTIYQLLTDRFARSDNSSAPCADMDTYCGGSFDGIIAHLDYIANLGFDAVWISPVPLNQPDEYHGYAAKDLTRINPHFGGEAGLKRLSDALHQRGMLLMVDVVANHMGIPPHYDFSDVVPFNSSSHYHGCSGCPAAIPGQKCWIQNFQNRTETQLCRLDGLPDLDQSVPFVRQQLLDWVKSLVARHGIDGLRIDTVPEVGPPAEFLGSFQQAANVYAVGEVFDGNVEFVASFQSKGKTKVLDGLLSYPLYFTLQSAFGPQRSSLVALGNLFDAYAQNFEDLDALGSFVENHDNPRFLVDCPDVQLYRSAIIYAFFSPGIPIGYYGGEQLFVGDANTNRLPLWPTHFAQDGEQYLWLSLVLSYRKHAAVWSHKLVGQILDDSVIAFSRGTTFVALTNNNQTNRVQRAVPGHSSPFAPGSRICNLFWPTQDCITVGSQGEWTLVLNDGEQKIFDLEHNIRSFVQREREERGRRWPARLVPPSSLSPLLPHSPSMDQSSGDRHGPPIALE